MTLVAVQAVLAVVVDGTPSLPCPVVTEMLAVFVCATRRDVDVDVVLTQSGQRGTPFQSYL